MLNFTLGEITLRAQALTWLADIMSSERLSCHRLPRKDPRGVPPSPPLASRKRHARFVVCASTVVRTRPARGVSNRQDAASSRSFREGAPAPGYPRRTDSRTRPDFFQDRRSKNGSTGRQDSHHPVTSGGRIVAVG